MVGKLFQAVVGTVLLPVAVVIDIATIPWIANDDRKPSSPKIAKSIVKNIEDVATGENS
jgi:hypothetical protein